MPVYARAVLDALRFSTLDQPLTIRTDEEWANALAFCDRTHLTLAFALRCDASPPAWVRRRLDRNLANNAERWHRAKSAYSEIASAFENASLEFIVLKGFSYAGLFVDTPEHRPQYDFDLFVAREGLGKAYEIATFQGYEAVRGSGKRAVDHLPVMIRKAAWQWRGDYFDSDVPLSLELHFQFWDERIERFTAVGIENFWNRRQLRAVDGLSFVSLRDVDAAGYASLHILRHLLRGNLLPSHVYELAWLLHHKADCDPFWEEWSGLHDESLRRLEAICFSLAQRWFHCDLHPMIQGEIDRLPSELSRWVRLYGDSPLTGLFHPNKDELWLHWNLVQSNRSRFCILRRRLFPGHLPGRVDTVSLTGQQIGWRDRMYGKSRDLAFIASRLGHHLRAIPATAASAVRWFSKRDLLRGGA